MALYSAFIGVDRHRDLSVRDLAGARRDATALWTLFSDSIPDITAALIVDADATVERLRRALDETLGVAGPDGHRHHHLLGPRDARPPAGRARHRGRRPARHHDLLRRTGHEGLTPLKLMALLQVIPESDGRVHAHDEEGDG